MTTSTVSFAPLLERFFTQRLMQQRQASPHTISSYRDTFRMLLKFAHQQLHTLPARLALQVIDAPLIVSFLDHLEKHRKLSVRSRNLRLPQSTPSFGMPRSKRRPMPPRSNAYWLFPASVSHAHKCTFSHAQRSRHCSLHPINAPGLDGAIMRFYWSRRRPVSVSRK